MEVDLLGPLRLRLDDGSCPPPGPPKLRALLTLLALRTGSLVDVDGCVDALWPDDPPPGAIASLRAYVSNLRRLLGAEAGRLVTSGRGYVLDLPPDALDVAAFERDADAGAAALADGDHAAAVARLEAALARWRGPALADVADLPFARPHAVRLEARRGTAAEDHVAGLLGLGAVSRAAALAEQLAAAAPLRERPHRLLMLALHRDGRSADALAVHARLRARLADEVGLDPSPALVELARRILRADPTLLDGGLPAAAPGSAPRPDVAGAARWASPGSGAPAGPAVVVRPAGRHDRAAARGADGPDPQAPLGREAELAAVDRLLEDLRAGRGGILVLGGEPGIGKTSLLEELARRAGVTGVPVAWGRASPVGGAPALWPWTQVVRELDAAGVGAVAGLGTDLPDVAALLGGPAAGTAVAPGATSREARFALQLAVVEHVGRCATGGGAVVLLDDLHWADAASCELAVLLAARAARLRVVLAVGHRTAPVDRTPALDTALAELERIPGVVRMELAGLDDAAVERLAERVAGAPPSPQDVARLRRLAGGNPFFVQQLAVAGEVDRDVPVGVRRVLRQRLAGLPDPVLDVLRAAALVGEVAEPGLLAAMLDRDVTEVLDALDVGVGHGLLVAGPGGPRFVHALVREAVDRDVPAGTAARLHAAATVALEACSEPPAHAVAEHCWRAGELMTADRLVHWSRRAAAAALALHAHEDAEQHLRRALRACDARGGVPAGEALAVRLALLQVLVAQHGWTSPQVTTVAARARDVVDRDEITAADVPLLWSLWTMHTTRGELAAGVDLADRVLAAARRLGDPRALVPAHVASAYVHLHVHGPGPAVHADLDAARAALETCGAAALPATPEPLDVALFVTRALAHATAGDAAATTVACEAALAAAGAAPFARAYARMFAAWAHAVLGDVEATRSHAQVGTETCERADLPGVATLLVATDAWSRGRSGADASAEADRIAAACATLVAAEHLHAVPFWLLLEADLRAVAGQDAAVLAVRDRALHLAATTGERLPPAWLPG